MHVPSATPRHARRALYIALIVGLTTSLPSARSSAQGARDVDSVSVAPGVRVPAGMRGASRAVVDSSDVRRAAALTFSELMQARAASVNVSMSGGRQIDGGQLLIRGPSTLTTDGAPLLIVDGIRMDEREDDVVGTTSRLDDVAIDDIATVEVLRGPSAAALYGSGASSGVLVVTTKRGRAGGWSAHVRASSETLRDATSYAERYRRRAVNPANPYITSCSLELEAAGSCTPGQVDQWRPIRDAGLLRTGVGALAAFDVAGGTTERDARLSLGLRRGSGISAGDALSRLSTRLNATQRIGKWLELTGRASYVGDRTENSKFADVIAGQSAYSVGTTPVDSFAHWATTTLDSAMGGRLDHLTTGVDVAVKPMPRLILRAALSRDRADEGAGYTTPSTRAPNTLSGALGDAASIGGPFENVTSVSTNREARVTGEYTIPLSVVRGAELLLVAGSERESRHRDAKQEFGVAGVSIRSIEYFPAFVNDAQFALARLQVLDRFAASIGARRERDGGVAGNGYHAHPVAELAIRPVPRILHGDLRLRGAYGESTQRRATFQAFPAIFPYPSYGSGYPYGYSYGGPPSEPIGSETMQETEGGVDLSWGTRGAISLTAYRRGIRNVMPDAQGFIIRPLELSSSGVEADARATIVERGSTHWSLRALVATNRNRVTTPGRTGAPERGVMSDQPVGVTMHRPYTYIDANADGIVEGTEQRAGEATVEGGGSTPTLTVALHSELTLGRRLTFGVIVDRRSGAWTQSSVAYSTCGEPEYACREMQDPTTPFDAQAATMANFLDALTGKTFDASFTRLREVSARWTLPIGHKATLGASGAHLMIAGRDLATWTKWPGTDPEVSSLPRATITRDDGSAVPLPRRLIVGLEFDY
jgi:TonB-dependent SusC/RagA subfamily outer membrane receptor